MVIQQYWVLRNWPDMALQHLLVLGVGSLAFCENLVCERGLVWPASIFCYFELAQCGPLIVGYLIRERGLVWPSHSICYLEVTQRSHLILSGT